MKLSIRSAWKKYGQEIYDVIDWKILELRLFHLMHYAPWGDDVLKPVGMDDWWTEIKNPKIRSRDIRRNRLTHLQSSCSVTDNLQPKIHVFLTFFPFWFTNEQMVVNLEVSKWSDHNQRICYSEKDVRHLVRRCIIWQSVICLC